MDTNTLCQYYFIINPAAGKGTLQSKIIQSIRDVLPSGSYHIYCTTGCGDGERYAAQITQKALEEGRTIAIYACGGDGTFYEVVNGTQGQMPVGIIPCGSGNDFVKNMRSDDPELLFNIEAQIQGIVHNVDLIQCNDRLAANACNVGFDADVAYNMTRFKRLPLVSGKLAYVLSILYCLTHQRNYPITIQMDAAPPAAEQVLFTAIANGQVYGGSFKGAPLASVRDGRIDVCLCRKISLLQLARFIGEFQKGTYLDNAAIMQVASYQKCSTLTIESQAPITVALDGNITHLTHLDVTMRPGMLQLIVPQGATLL